MLLDDIYPWDPQGSRLARVFCDTVLMEQVFSGKDRHPLFGEFLRAAQSDEACRSKLSKRKLERRSSENNAAVIAAVLSSPDFRRDESTIARFLASEQWPEFRINFARFLGGWLTDHEETQLPDFCEKSPEYSDDFWLMDTDRFRSWLVHRKTTKPDDQKFLVLLGAAFAILQPDIAPKIAGMLAERDPSLARWIVDDGFDEEQNSEIAELADWVIEPTHGPLRTGSVEGYGEEVTPVGDVVAQAPGLDQLESMVAALKADWNKLLGDLKGELFTDEASRRVAPRTWFEQGAQLADRQTELFVAVTASEQLGDLLSGEGEIATPDDLETVEGLIERAKQAKADREAHVGVVDAAREWLESVRTLAVGEDVKFDVAMVRGEADKLLAQLATPDAIEAKTLEALREGRHPLYAIHQLIEVGDNLGNAKCTVLEHIVEQAYGRQMMRAIMRKNAWFEVPEAPAAEAPDAGDSETVDETEPANLEPQEAPGESEPVADDVEPSAGENASPKTAVDQVAREPESEPPQSIDPSSPPQADESVAVAQPPEVVPPAEVEDIIASAEDRLCDYETFWSGHWINSRGECEPAPWLSDEFVARVNAASIGALHEDKLWRAFVFAKAVEESGAQASVASADVAALASFWQNPTASSVANSADAVEFRTVDEVCDTSPVGLQIRLALMALGNARFQVVYPDDAQTDRMLAQAQVDEGPVGEMIRELIRARVLVSDTVQMLRDACSSLSARTEDQIRQDFELGRRRFQDFVQEIWSAAGGRVCQTHCRKAWGMFIDKVGEALKGVYREQSGGKKGWSAGDLRALRDRISGVFLEIADRQGFLYEDRARGDRVVEDLVSRLERLAGLCDELSQLKAGRSDPRTVGLQTLLTQLKSDGRSWSPGQRLVRLILLHACQRSPLRSNSPLSIDLGEFVTRPGLLAYFNEAPAIPMHAELDAEIADARDFSEWVAAAGLLVEPGDARLPDASDAPPVIHVRDRLRRDRRIDLLQALVIGAVPNRGPIADHDLNTEFADEYQSELSVLRRKWIDLDKLAAESANRLKGILDEAERRIDDSDDARWNPLLGRCWIATCNEAADDLRGAHITRLTDRAQRIGDSDRRQAAESYLDKQMYADVLLVMGDEDVSTRSLGSRQTIWRREAETRFADARSRSTDEFDSPMLLRWLKRTRVHASHDIGFLKEFIDLVAPDLEDPPRVDSDSRSLRIAMSQIRELMSKVNPCFIPQLTQYQELVVMLGKVPVGDASYDRDIANEVDRSLPQNALVAVLSPGITDAQSRRFNDRMRNRRTGSSIAQLDDCDMFRLALCQQRDGNLLMGLLELLFEQLDLGRVQPFNVHEGQQIQMEMFVGRTEEARRLAEQSRYSRLFSGRKLGKTSLLKYVERTMGGGQCQLPSGHRLRVLYVQIVGMKEDDKVADAILAGLKMNVASGGNADAGDRLQTGCVEYLAANADESLLIVLDEADEFVAAQIRKSGETGLSWRMRQIEGLYEEVPPRVRFVVSGYKCTYTSEGAWGNWHDVLILKPLKAKNAAALVEGPFTRIGIDVAAQAPEIAFRCGFQPAVLLRFGQRLLDRLRRRGFARRDGWEVTAADVAEVFADPAVREEIEESVDRNFQGDRRGEIVFKAALEVFHRASPNASIPDLSERVVGVLIEADSDLDWLQSRGSAESEVGGYLRQFCQRELLQLDRDKQDTRNARYHRLRFPHHLPILHRGDSIQLLSQMIARTRQEAEGVGYDDAGAYLLLPPEKIQELGEMRGSDLSLPVAGIVLASHWSDALENPVGGVIERLIDDPSQKISASACNVSKLAAGPMVVLDPNTDLAEKIVSAWRDPSPPVVLCGGADLYRWALNHEAAWVEAVGIGRLTAASVRWWFSRVQGIEFSGKDAIQQIMLATGGVPILMGAVEGIIRGPHGQSGFDVSRKRLQDSLAAFAAERDEILQQLIDGPPSIRLSERETELLRLTVVVSQLSGDNANMREDMTRDWGELIEIEGVKPLGKNATEEDKRSLRLLQDLGVVPVDPSGSTPEDRITPMTVNDPVRSYLGSAIEA